MIFFKNQALMPLLWLVMALIPLLIGEFFLRRKQERQFLEGRTEKNKLAGDQLRRSLYIFFAALFALAALLRPSWNPSVRLVEKEGRDVVFLLDVSRSMTASDVAPSRLERAKLEIAETVQVIEGDRIALVAFAGNSVVKSPLTMDYGFFSLVLENLSVNSVSRGGSQLGDALRMVESQVFDDRSREERDIILITDGEDQESFPVEAAQALGSQGVRLIVIGLGDDIQGARVMDGEGNYLVHEGQEVWSRMNGDILRQMAAATPGGSYVPAGQANFSLPRIYRSLVGQSAGKSTGEEETLVYEEKYQFFLVLALVFILLEAFRIIGPVKRENLSFKNIAMPFTGKSSALLLIPLLGLFIAPPLSGEGRADLYRQGEDARASQNWERFREIYDELTERGVSQGKTAYNRGLSQFEQGNFSEAAGSFGDAASQLEGQKAAQALYNRGNSLLKEAENNTEAGGGLATQAREAYEKALEIDPGFTEAAHNLELLLNQQQDQQEQSEGDDSSDGEGDGNGENGESDSGGEQGDNQSGDNPPESGDQSPSEEEQDDSLAQEILDQEEEDRNERESTMTVSGGIYQVEKDW